MSAGLCCIKELLAHHLNIFEGGEHLAEEPICVKFGCQQSNTGSVAVFVPATYVQHLHELKSVGITQSDFLVVIHHQQE